MLSCNLREELMAISERQDICNEMGECFLLQLKVIGTSILTSSLVIRKQESYQHLFRT